MNQWWPPDKIAAGMAVPGYAVNHSYNVVNFAFWTTGGPVDIATVWANLITYISTDNPWGAKTLAEAQKAWIDIYHAHGIKVLVSAFGSTDFPTSRGVDPVQCGKNLAQFVIANQLDGVDLDWEDNDAMNAGKGEDWLISITKTLRELLPQGKYIISHAPQAPYFMGKPQYPNGGYLTVDAAVGDLIDFYNVQFYNQGTSAYSTYNTLFQQTDGWAKGTSVMEMEHAGIPLSRILIGKPITQGDASNTGYIPVGTFRSILQQAMSSIQWKGGFMGWQFKSDTDGSWSHQLASVFSQ